MPTTTHAPPALTGPVALAGDPGRDDARSAFSLLLDQQPAAVAPGRSFAVVMAAFVGGPHASAAAARPAAGARHVRSSPPVVLRDVAMDPRDPVALNLAHRLLDRLPADTIDELMANVGPGSHRGQTVTTSGPARAEPAAGERLGDVKSLYDPLDVFKGNDRVPPANRQL